MKTQKAICLMAAAAMVAMLIGISACSTAPPSASEKAQKQESVRDMANQTLSQLYANQPSARDAVMNAAGYAVFSDFGFKFLYGGGARGKGLAVNNASMQQTFMEMAELQPGLGFGASKFRVVFIFGTPEALDNFVNSGWEFSASAMAVASTQSQGAALSGAVRVSDDVQMMQLDDQGVIAGVSITAAKYYKDSELN
jgi:lipid-binding SYLF domain-containing protein